MQDGSTYSRWKSSCLSQLNWFSFQWKCSRFISGTCSATYKLLKPHLQMIPLRQMLLLQKVGIFQMMPLHRRPKQQRLFSLFLHDGFVLTSGSENWLFIFHDDSILKGLALFKKKKRRTRTHDSDIRSLETGTWGSMPSILSEGGTLRPLGMVMLPKSTKKATHQTDNHSEEIEIIRITIFKKCPLEILSWCKRLMDM